MVLLNKEHHNRVRGLGKQRTWTNTWSTTAASQSSGFQNEVKTNFEKMQEHMIALQQHGASLKEQLLPKDMGASVRDSYEGCPYTLDGVGEHV